MLEPVLGKYKTTLCGGFGHVFQTEACFVVDKLRCNRVKGKIECLANKNIGERQDVIRRDRYLGRYLLTQYCSIVFHLSRYLVVELF